jgi:hypothetical protein
MDLGVDRAEILVMDPLGHLRTDIHSLLVEVKQIYYMNLYSSWLQNVLDES